MPSSEPVQPAPEGAAASTAVPRRSRAGGARKVPARYASTEHTSRALNDAIRAHRRGDLRAALAHYGSRIAEAPECLDAWLNAGSAEARLGRARAAIAAFDHALHALDLGGVDAKCGARACRDVGLGLFTVGELERARDVMRRAVAADPELLGAWLHLARLELETGEQERAVAAARRAMALEREGTSALLELARCAFAHDDPSEALAALQTARERPLASPQSELFALLVSHHAGAEAHATTLGALAALGRRHPGLASEVDAATHLLTQMDDARWFGSARATLRFAAHAAPAGGATVELGVHHGVSLRWLAECRDGPLHGFDSFDGLPTDWATVPRGRFTTDGQTPRAVPCRFWVGLFDDQLPKFVEQHPEPISLLHVDSDLYASAVSGLTHLAPLVGPGSVIAFDEYLGHKTWREDEFRAFAEASTRYGWRFEHLAVNPFTGQTVVRLL